MNFLEKITVLSIAVSVVAAVEFAKLPELSRVSDPLEIYPKEQRRSLFSDLGIADPVRQCGGSGRVLQWRNEACTLKSQGACVYPANKFLRGEVTFVPSQSSESLGLRTLMKDPVTGGVYSAWENPNLENSAVEAGKEFTFGGNVEILPELRGRRITTQLSIFRESDKEVEVCAETDFLVV